MRSSIIGILCCPLCKGKLELRIRETKTLEDGEEDVLEGTLTCVQCGIEYPIREGIPDFLPGDTGES